MTIAFAAGTADASGAPARRTVRVADGVYALQHGAPRTLEEGSRSANAGFIVGPAGVAVIDTGVSYRDGVEILAAVRKVTPRPIRLAILTHPDQAVIFGAAAFQERGIPVYMQRGAAGLMAARCEMCLRNLQAALGDAEMASTTLIVPDRLIEGDETIDAIGRPLRVIAPAWSSAPGAVAVLDPRSATLFAGSLVSVHAVPDTRDANARGWRDALRTLAATRCRHLVPSHGPVGRCSDIESFSQYFSDLEDRVGALLRGGTGLAEIGASAALPRYSGWGRYQELQRANANRAYLRLERALFDLP
jgi:glyoxylase-like metal-dependent hydrolase (beta-lactamase superfamily II)